MNKITDENKASLSGVLSHLMAVNGLTSSELARKTGVAQPVIYRLVSGGVENPQILTLRPLADYFRISIDQLLGLAPLSQQRIIDNELLHDVTNKLTTIKTISTILIDVMPGLTEAYQKAVVLNLIKETISLDILPLLQMNTANLLKAANSIQTLLMKNDRNPQGEV